MAYVAGLDLGTSSCKLVVYDLRGRRVFGSIRRYRMYVTGESKVEQDPNEWWGAVRELLREAARALGARVSELRAIGISSQAPTLLPVDRRGNPLHNALIWSDMRAVKEAELLSSATGERILPNNGLARILWFMKNMPEVFSKVHKFLNALDWIIFKLTGNFVTDSLTAMICMYGVGRELWSKVLEEFDIPADLLPNIVEPGTLISRIKPEVADEVGLHHDIDVVIGSIDAYVAMLGASAIREGVLAEIMGSSICLMLATNKDYSNAKKLPTTRHVLPYLKAVAIPINNGGVVLEWLGNLLGKSTSELIELATKSPPGANGVLTLPFIFKERVPLVANPQFITYGLRYSHGLTDFIRSVIEGLVYNVRTYIDFIRDSGYKIEYGVAVGGYSRFEELIKLHADIVGCPYRRTQDMNATALGSAILASRAANLYATIEEACSNMVHYVSEFRPSGDRRKVYDEAFRKYSKLLSQLNMLST